MLALEMCRLSQHHKVPPSARWPLLRKPCRRPLRFVARFDALHMDLGVELAGEPLENGASEPGLALRLDYRLSF